MAGLLYKEWLVHRLPMILYFLAGFFFAHLFDVDTPLPMFAVLAMFITVFSATLEERNNNHVLINSLPVTRSQVVTAKYVFNILLGWTFVGMAAVVYSLLHASNGISMLEAGLAMASVVWYAAVFFPMYYWLGPRFVQLGMILFFLFTFVLVPMVRSQIHVPDMIRWLPSASWIALSAVFFLTSAILFISWSLSVRIYGSKDF